MNITPVIYSVLAASLLWGCGDSQTPDSGDSKSATPAAAPPTIEAPSAPKSKAPAPAATARAEPQDPPSSKPSTSSRTREAIDPDGALMNWIFVDWAGIDPQLEKTAAITTSQMRMFDGTEVNEFTRADVEAKELARLQALFEESLGYGSITTNIGGTLSQYDFEYGEFYLSQFSPGSTVSFGYTGVGEYRKVEQFLQSVQLVNALEAYIWKVPPEEARQIIDIFEQDRNTDRKIYTRVKMTIIGADVEKGLLQARLDQYELFTNPMYTGNESRKLTETSF